MSNTAVLEQLQLKPHTGAWHGVQCVLKNTEEIR